MTKAKETIASATEKCKDVENKMKVGLSAGVVRILKTFEFLESLKFSFIHFGPWKSLKNNDIEEMKVRYGQPVMQKAEV